MSPTTVLHNGSSLRSSSSHAGMSMGLGLQCPVCGCAVDVLHPLDPAAGPSCTACGFAFHCVQGVWRALAPSREERFQQFIHEYQTVRAKEGRGASGCHYYLALPHKDMTGRNSWQWKIRARSFRYLERRVLPRLEREKPEGLNILDVGAGNCWLCYRLALRGHRPVAVDLLLNDRDGLGAARHYLLNLSNPFPCFQAEMDRLPFASRQFDLVVFNASFHYSENYALTLREAVRCLRRLGHVLILDSPFYFHEASGRKMLAERRAQFESRFGFPSNSIPSQEYLTPRILQELAGHAGLAWEVFKPWYGLGWALRPVKAWLLRRREPAKFYVFGGALAAS